VNAADPKPRAAAALGVLLALWAGALAVRSACDAAGAAAPPRLALHVNANSATAAELELLPKIGATLAARIVAQRETFGPYQRLADLDRVPGLGPATLAAIEPYLDFSAPRSADATPP
jgi:competence ComEA-like helix-hairpin-helix protein